MPIIQIKIAARADAALSSRIAAAIAPLSAEHLGKDPGLTAIAIDYTAPEHWFVGGQALSERRTRSYFLEIRITDETNTRAEKTRYIAAVHAAMQGLLAPLEEESYVHVHDARGEAYGYGGRTQAARYHAP